MFDALFIDSFSIEPRIEEVRSTTHWANNSVRGQGETDIDLVTQGYGLELSWIRRIEEQWALMVRAAGTKHSVANADVVSSQTLATNEQLLTSTDGDTDAASSYEVSIGGKTRWFGKHGHYATAHVGARRSSADVLSSGEESLVGGPLSGVSFSVDDSTSDRFLGFASEHQVGSWVFGASLEFFQRRFDGSYRGYELDDIRTTELRTDGHGHTLMLAATYTISASWDVSGQYSDLTARGDTHDAQAQSGDQSFTETLSDIQFRSETFRLATRYVF